MNAAGVLTPEAAAARWPDLTPQGLAILRALDAAGRPLGRFALSKAVGCSVANIGRLLLRTATHGFTTDAPREVARDGYAPLVALTEKGRERARRPTQDIAPPVATDLPARMPLSEREHALLRLLRSEAREGRIPSYSVAATAIGCHRANVGRVIDGLRRAGLVVRDPTAPRTHSRVALTSLGTAVAEGLVRVVAVTEAPEPRKPGVVKAPAPKPAAAPLRPKTLPPRPRREVGSPPLPPVVEAPPALATFRGVKHPPMPEAHGAPPGMREETWAAMTTVRGMGDWRAA